jgi:hypothetical protein
MIRIIILSLVLAAELSAGEELRFASRNSWKSSAKLSKFIT